VRHIQERRKRPSRRPPDQDIRRSRDQDVRRSRDQDVDPAAGPTRNQTVTGASSSEASDVLAAIDELLAAP
jgi:hypothetical protein